MDKQRGKLFVVSAPSGAGKTSLVKEVLKRLQRDDIQRVITFTSKIPSSLEIQGVDYHFVSEEDFKAKIEQDFFVEHSTEYGAYYGLPKSGLFPLDEGCSCIAIVDKEGAFSLKAHEPSAILVMIEPPGKDVLESRLKRRARDSNDTIIFRLGLADKELAAMKKSSLYNYVIVNSEFDKAVVEFEQIIKKELGHTEEDGLSAKI